MPYSYITITLQRSFMMSVKRVYSYTKATRFSEHLQNKMKVEIYITALESIDYPSYIHQAFPRQI